MDVDFSGSTIRLPEEGSGRLRHVRKPKPDGGSP